MTRTFLVEVEGETVKITLSSDGLTVMGQIADASISELKSNLYSLVLNGHSYLIHMHPDADSLMTIDGHTIRCNFVSDRSKLISQYGQHTESLEITTELRAPMPGLITNISVEAGDSVTEGQGLVILEAMKMENELLSPCTATIRQVHVKNKDAVSIDTLLIEFES
ncbi:MAG: acetyl-CoA carboxylase biotin carboxyl carrier protein subunit [Bacteroidetes bacterium]|nr:acetyl-CoA carboxylase biotin carboxyl carrier protein subunit [Bacteroidota bacterium]MCY4233994.1 acetyl-CoA carboxylase biotin carboxyl carrier protein subunit [Bacteroidota bacterium]